MNIYSVEIQIAATLYVKAESVEQAHQLAAKTVSCDVEINCDEVGSRDDGPSEHSFVLDLVFDDPRLPNVSMSPYVTLHGIWPNSKPIFIEELTQDETR